MTIQRWLRNHECAERLRRVSAVAGRNTTSEDCPSAPCSHRAEVVVESLAGVVPMSDVSCALEIKVTSQPAPAWTHPWERLPALEATVAPSVELKAGAASASVTVYGSKDFDDDGTRSFELRVAQCTAVNESDVVPRSHGRAITQWTSDPSCSSQTSTATSHSSRLCALRPCISRAAWSR